ncbi:MAG: hypothetical protein ACFFA8_06960 [Promethearchaeota archaeon]
MKKIIDKNKLWIFSLFSGIIAVIALLTPAWGISVSSYSFIVWLWGLEISTDLGIRFVSTQFLIIGIISSILISISGLLLILTSYKNHKKNARFGNFWIIQGLIIIIAPIIYIVGLEIQFPGFFGEYLPGTVFLGPLISGFLAIFVGVADKKLFLKKNINQQ